MKVSRESLAILTIGVVDLITTLVFIHTRGAEEANPMFRMWLAFGPIWFAAMKIVMLVGPICILEFARRTRPIFTRRASQSAVALYLAAYICGFVRLNSEVLFPSRPPIVVASYTLHLHSPRVNVGSHTAGTTAAAWVGQTVAASNVTVISP